MKRLRNYQRDTILFGLTHPRFNLFGGMGVGKTAIALHIADALQTLGDLTRPVLVLAPAYVAENTWSAEVARWAGLSGLTVVPIVGTEKQRRAALTRDAAVYTMAYDNLQWLGAQFPKSWPFGMVIADESTRLKSFRLTKGSKRAQVLARFAHRQATHWINLTGTPTENGLTDLWGQQWFIDGGRRLGRSYTEFEQRWFRSVRNGPNAYATQQTALPFADEQIRDAIADVSLTVDAADHFDLEQPIVNTIKLPIPGNVRTIYRKLERELYAEVAGYDIDAATAKTMKLRQLASGVLYHGAEDDPAEWLDMHEAKIEALRSIVNEAGGMPVLCSIAFRSDRARILDKVPGAVDLQTKPGMARFLKGDATVGIAHPRSLGYGVDGLQHVTNILAIYSDDWALGPRLQMIERIGPVRQAQAGYRRPVFVHELIAEQTVDEDIKLRHETKREVLDVLLAGLRARAA